MPKQRGSSDAPWMDSDDDLSVQEVARDTTAQTDPESLTVRVQTAINQMSASGPNAEEEYQLMLRALVREPEQAAAAIAGMYRETPEDQYIARWAQVQLLSDLRDDATLSAFDDILSTPIPPEKAPLMITYSTVGEEVMIRTTAIDGITRLAARGDRRAIDVLRKHTQHEALSVRRAAIQGYLQVAGPDAREELRKMLPERDHFLLDIRRVDVRDVPQPQIERPSEEQDQVPPARLWRPTPQE
jgi:hypothetical protein